MHQLLLFGRLWRIPFALSLVLPVIQHDLPKVYVPPPASASVVAPIQFNSAELLDPKFHQRFEDCDQEDICDGVKLTKDKCSTDPSRNTTFLRLADGTIFFDAKMAIDADGSEMAKTNPGMTDQADTSYRYPLPGKPSLDSDRVPYVVIPASDFENTLGIELGDIAAVVFRQRVTFAIVGDHGPKCKIGEGSIKLHKTLRHDVCKKRNNRGVCTSVGSTGIGSDVLYFIFPGSKAKIADGLTPDNINERLEKEGQALWNKLQSSYSGIER